MDKTTEILIWYRNCIATGSICLSTQKYYMDNYLRQYDDAIRLYNKEVFEAKFPKVRSFNNDRSIQ